MSLVSILSKVVGFKQSFERYWDLDRVLRIYLLDTNHCSRIISKDVQIIYRLTNLNQGAILATSVIVCGELMYGAENSARKSENLLLVRSFIVKMNILSIDGKIFETYALIKAKIFNRFAPKEKSLRRKYRFENLGFKDNDLWIAATGICHNATIVSSDNDFKRMLDVNDFPLECWI